MTWNEKDRYQKNISPKAEAFCLRHWGKNETCSFEKSDFECREKSEGLYILKYSDYQLYDFLEKMIILKSSIQKKRTLSF